MIMMGIALVYVDRIETAQVSLAAGVLGEFIASIFFYLYNRTISEMSNYHQKLVLTQNISLALRIAEGLPAKAKKDAQLKLIESLSNDINRYLTMQVSKTLGTFSKSESNASSKIENNS